MFLQLNEVIKWIDEKLIKWHCSGHSVSTVPLSTRGRWVVESDGHRKKRLSQAFCVTPGGGMSLLLKVLLLAVSTWWTGWVLLSRILCSLHSILLSDTSTKESSWTPRTEPAFLMILLILLVSAALSLLPQHTTAKKIILATTYW